MSQPALNQVRPGAPAPGPHPCRRKEMKPQLPDQRVAGRAQLAKNLSLIQALRSSASPDVLVEIAEILRTGLADYLLRGVISSDEHNAILGSYVGSNGTAVNFGPGSLALTVDAPMTNNTT